MGKKIKVKEYMNWDKTITNGLTPIEAIITIEESIARWEHIKANWKYHFMKCVKPKRELRRRNK